VPADPPDLSEQREFRLSWVHSRLANLAQSELLRRLPLKRPDQHVTDSQGDAIFRWELAKWAVNGSERDYGWDYVVEVFRNGVSTGLTFNAQLKSSLHTGYSSDGVFISQSLERDAADYLARQLHQPTFLFHADVNTKKLFWSAIQLDEAVLTALERGETESLTVRVLTANSLPGRFAHFLADLTRSQTIVVSRLPPELARNVVGHAPDLPRGVATRRIIPGSLVQPYPAVRGH
jgi:hypothetical protein